MRREGLEELGTTYVKLGQLISSRPDLLPDVYIDELGKLVDDVPAVPYAALEPIIDAEIGLQHFSRIDPKQLATASIGQIHRALMKSGRVIHPLVSERVRVLEEIKGEKVSEADGLEPERAQHLARAFFRAPTSAR